MEDYKIKYLSLGAGIQSTALLILSNKGTHPKIPRADVAIFADTGDEPSWVYDNVERLKEWSDIPVEVVSAGCLSKDVIARHRGELDRCAPIPVFTNKNGETTILKRGCTEDYKAKPIEKMVRSLLGYEPRQRIPPNSALALIGISAEENARMRPSKVRWVKRSYPLFDARITRQDCYPIIKAEGLQVPGKSSCRYCPFHNNAYWRELKEKHVDEWEKACQFDEAIRDMSASGVLQPVYLHRSLQPLREAPIGDDHPELFDPFSFRSECEGICGT